MSTRSCSKRLAALRRDGCPGEEEHESTRIHTNLHEYVNSIAFALFVTIRVDSCRFVFIFNRWQKSLGLETASQRCPRFPTKRSARHPRALTGAAGRMRSLR